MPTITAFAAPLPKRRARQSLGLVGTSLLALLAVLPAAPATAQRAPDSQTLQMQGRAPLSFADIVERVKPAVVSINVTSGGAKVASKEGQKGAPGNRGRGPELFPNLPDDHPLNEFFKNLPRGGEGGPSQPRLGQGSGFVISPDGYVVTNNHVVDGATKIQVSFSEKDKYEAEMIGTDQRTDIALLKIKSSRTFQHVKFTDKLTRVGDWVLAVGNPFGLGGTVTAGIVSAHGRDINAGPYDYLQIDAAVNRGNSGGPTFNLDGDVVGVNTAIYSPSGGNVGIAFAVPARTAMEVVEQLKASGSVSRGWLGVKIQNIDEDTASSLGLAEPKGALVSEVTANGPAQDAGMKLRDVILSINGEKIADSRDLARKVAGYAPNANVDVRIQRDGKEQALPVKLGKFPAGTELAKLEQGAPTTTEMDQLGLTVAPPPKNKDGSKIEGVVITDVDVGSDAADKGLKRGDLILDIGGQLVSTPEEVASSVKKAKELGRPSVLFRVKSGDQTRFVAVKLKADGGKAEKKKG